MSSDLPGVNPATLNGILLYYHLMTKMSGLSDSTELSRVGLSQMAAARSSTSRSQSSPIVSKSSCVRVAVVVPGRRHDCRPHVVWRGPGCGAWPEAASSRARLSHLVLEKQIKCIPICMPRSSFIHIVDKSE
jgi:hypothetical protein